MNAFETKIADSLRKSGWTVLSRGWPDFLVHRLNRRLNLFEVAGVEVKYGRDKLSPEQEEVHKVLKAVGIPVSVIREDYLYKAKRVKSTGIIFSADKKRLREEVQDLVTEGSRLIEKARELTALIDNLSVMTEPSQPDMPVIGNGDITQPTQAELFRLQQAENLAAVQRLCTKDPAAAEFDHMVDAVSAVQDYPGKVQNAPPSKT